MPRIILLVFMVLTLGLANWVAAQPGPPPGPGPEFAGGGFQDRFLEVKRKQLGPALGVNQQTVDHLLAIDQRYKPLRHQLVMGMKTDMQRLQQLMSQPAPPEQEITALLGEMKRRRQEMLNLQQRKDEEEMALLAPVQQARYLLYLMNLIREARNIKGGLGGPGGLGPPAFSPPREIPVSRPPQ